VCLNELAPRQGMTARAAAAALRALRCLPGLRRWPSPSVFPGMLAFPTVRDAVAKSRPDIILGIWSWESLQATYAIAGVPKFMYYGNPDHKPTEARLKHPELFDMETRTLLGKVRHRYNLLVNRVREIQHLQMAGRCEVMANNSLVDAEYYQAAGHPRSIYLHNMWPEARPALPGPAVEIAHGVARITGSVGNLGATGNTFGLYYIGRHVAPGLETRLGNGNFTIDIFGGGRPSASVAKVLEHPAIRRRGWVDDIDAEIRNSCAFLVLTNVEGFIVGNTRILLAWSLGACVIAHTDSALSMPEMRHMENVLLGATPDEINDLICKAARDPELRARIGRGGYDTFQRYYRSDTVVPKMLEEMRKCVAAN